MSLFEQVIKRPAFTVAVAVSIAAVGAAGAFGLGRAAASTKPAVVANLIYAGANAGEVERTLVNPLEARIAALPGVDKVESSARAGMATVTVWFESENDGEVASGPLADAVHATAGHLGSSVGIPSIVRFDPELVSPSIASVRELAPSALVAAALTLAIILMLLRSRSAAVIVLSAVVLTCVATLGILRPAELGVNASTVAGLMLASILIVDAAIRARDSFGRHLAVRLQRRTAAQAAGAELGRGVATVLALTVVLLAAFFFSTGNTIAFVKSIATITTAGAMLALVVAAPVVLALSSIWEGKTRGTGKRTFFTGVLYAFDGRLDRVADRYHEMLAWTLDRRRVTPIFAFSALVLGVVVLHGRRAIAPRVEVGGVATLTATDRAPICLAVRGPDWQTLSGVAQRVARELKGTSGITNVRVSARPHDDASVIADDLALSTDVSPATNRLAPEDDPEIIESSSPIQIDHLDGDRVVRVEADITGATRDVLSNVHERVASVPLPPQYRVTIEGPLAETRRATLDVLRRLGLASVILTLLLAWHLRSPASVLTVLLTLGLTGLGTTVAISAVRLPFDVFALFGGAVAIALVSAHAIAAVDYANGHRLTAVSTRVSVIEAARIQFRPLLTTTLAAVATLSPLVFVGRPSTEAFASLGMAAVGGIIVGSLAVLFALPTFSIAIAEWLRRRGEPLL